MVSDSSEKRFLEELTRKAAIDQIILRWIDADKSIFCFEFW